MKKKIFNIFIVLTSLLHIACTDQDDNGYDTNLQVNRFIWRGLNAYYLWQPDVADLADNRFANEFEKNSFLSNYTPFDLFNTLKMPAPTDRFSVLFDDYRTLEGILSGNTKTTGIDYSLFYVQGSTTDIYGSVNYVLPNSPASQLGITRGDVFYAINNESLTVSNYKSLLGNETLNIHFAQLSAGNIIANGVVKTVTKIQLQENPIYHYDIINLGTKKIGYLVYNAFLSDYESALNNVFGYFKGQGITHLIVDLRYNSGGSVATATRLASMITGQFSGQVFAKQQWNPKLQNYLLQNNPSTLNNLFTTTLSNGGAIQSLNLSKVYILTAKGTASASELLINGLKPYINVVQIGDVTTGKNVGSVTLYDSPNFTKNQINPNHNYAMQPIVLKIVNASNFGDYTSGLQPNSTFVENRENMGVLGDTNEPLLATALNYIASNGKFSYSFKSNNSSTYFRGKKEVEAFQDEMYLERE